MWVESVLSIWYFWLKILFGVPFLYIYNLFSRALIHACSGLLEITEHKLLKHKVYCSPVNKYTVTNYHRSHWLWINLHSDYQLSAHWQNCLLPLTGWQLFCTFLSKVSKSISSMIRFCIWIVFVLFLFSVIPLMEWNMQY